MRAIELLDVEDPLHDGGADEPAVVRSLVLSAAEAKAEKAEKKAAKEAEEEWEGLGEEEEESDEDPFKDTPVRRSSGRGGRSGGRR